MGPVAPVAERKSLHAIALMMALVGLFGGCKESNESAPATAKSQAQVFSMRGVVEAPPTSVFPRRLRIHHEAASDMPSMTMAFTAGEGG